MKLPNEERQEKMLRAVERLGYDPSRVLSHELVEAYDRNGEHVYCRVVEDQIYIYLYHGAAPNLEA